MAAIILIVKGVIGTMPLLLKLVGFRAAGVAAGSIASLIQSMIGNIASGGIFAFCQPIGASGLTTVMGTSTLLKLFSG